MEGRRPSNLPAMIFDDLLLALTWLAVAVLAVAGALTASRKQLDPVGFMLVACLCAFGGGRCAT